jgi:hypothetical protein
MSLYNYRHIVFKGKRNISRADEHFRQVEV